MIKKVNIKDRAKKIFIRPQGIENVISIEKNLLRHGLPTDHNFSSAANKLKMNRCSRKMREKCRSTFTTNCNKLNSFLISIQTYFWWWSWTSERVHDDKRENMQNSKISQSHIENETFAHRERNICTKFYSIKNMKMISRHVKKFQIFSSRLIIGKWEKSWITFYY
jgi:hypothetical protein